MRVIHVVPSIEEEASGPSYAVVRLWESQRASGVEAELATVTFGKCLATSNHTKVFPLGKGPRRIAPSPDLHRHLREGARAGAIELIHNHGIWTMPNVYPGLVARATGVPLVVSPHGTLSAWATRSGSPLKRLFWPLVQRRAIAIARAFHATAEAEAEDIRRMDFRQPIAVIPNGIDLPPLAPKVPLAHRTLLFLGRIHPVKGVDLLLEAWDAVHRDFPEWRLRIVGPDNGGQLTAMQELAKRKQLARVEFPGPLYGEAKLQAYREADLFVLPSHSENFGVAVAEALAAATPAIVTTGAPWRGLIDHQAGWWIPTDAAALSEALRDALTRSPQDLAARGERGRQWMARDFSWQRIGEASKELYAWLLGQGDRPSCVVTD